MSHLITFGRLDSTDFRSLSAEQGGWTPVAGEPNARVHTLVDNEYVWAGVATFEPCQISVSVDHHGVLQILEGEATLTIDGESRNLTDGDVAFYEPGLELNWEIKTPVREYFIVTKDGRGK